MNGPWSFGNEAEETRNSELKEMVLTITRLLSSLDDDEVVAVTATILDCMPEELSHGAMLIVAKRMDAKVRKRKK